MGSIKVDGNSNKTDVFDALIYPRYNIYLNQTFIALIDGVNGQQLNRSTSSNDNNTITVSVL